MLDKLRKRLRSEKGFTLIELLVVMIILAILTAIAIPSYLSFRDRANKSAAGADLRSVDPVGRGVVLRQRHVRRHDRRRTEGVLRPVDQRHLYTILAAKQRGNELLRPGHVADDATKTAAKAGPSAQIVIGGACVSRTAPRVIERARNTAPSSLSKVPSPLCRAKGL